MTTITQPDRLITLRDAARALGVAERTLRAWAATARLPVVRLSSRCVRVALRDLDAFIEERRRG